MQSKGLAGITWQTHPSTREPMRIRNGNYTKRVQSNKRVEVTISNAHNKCEEVRITIYNGGITVSD